MYNTLLDICVRTKDDERGYEVIDRMCAMMLACSKHMLHAQRMAAVRLA